MLNNISLIAAATAGGEGPVEPNPLWLPYDLNELYWGTAAFAIVAFLIWKLARKPIADFFRGRIERISEELGAAEKTRVDAEAERDRIKAALADSDTEAARIIAEARTGADQLTAEIAARTEVDVVTIRERGVADLATTRAQAQSDIAGELSRLSLGAAERVVESSLDDSAQQRLIDDYIGQVGSQN